MRDTPVLSKAVEFSISPPFLLKKTYNNWHRYYDPQTGRYLTPDPIGLAGGINLYAYVQQNPVNLVDPWGLNPYLDGVKGGASSKGTGETIGGIVGAGVGGLIGNAAGSTMPGLGNAGLSALGATAGSALGSEIGKQFDKPGLNQSSVQQQMDRDSDGDGINDYFDLDDDNDGISDAFQDSKRKKCLEGG